MIGAIAGFVIVLVFREQKVHHHDHAHADSAHGHNFTGTHFEESNSADNGSVKASCSEGVSAIKSDEHTHGSHDYHDEDEHAEHDHIHELCEHDHCHCEEDGIFLSAVKHTLQITFFIMVIGFVLNLILHFVGEDVLANLILNRPIIGPVLAGIVGLIPNCAASVTVTQLYLSGVISLGAMMSGLLVGAGVGLLVLFRVNPDKRENLKIVGLLYVIGVLTGIVINWL